MCREESGANFRCQAAVTMLLTVVWNTGRWTSRRTTRHRTVTTSIINIIIIITIITVIATRCRRRRSHQRRGWSLWATVCTTSPTASLSVSPPTCTSTCVLSDCYSAPDRGAGCCDDLVCLSVCVCVCFPRAFLRKYTSDLYQFFGACYRWPWLGHPLAASRYVMYFRFYG